MQHTTRHIKIAIKPTETAGSELCAVCGNLTAPQKPFDLFLDATAQLVCKHCAAKYAPDLVSLMDYFYKGHYVVAEYEEIENEINALKALADSLQTADMQQLQEDLRALSRRAYVLRKFIAASAPEPQG